MTRRGLISVVLLATFCIVIFGVLMRHHRRSANQPYRLDGARLEKFRSLDPIDAHTHVFQNSADLLRMLQRLNVHTLDILYVDNNNPYLKNLEAEKADAEQFVRSSRGQAQLCTTFDPFEISQRDFPRAAIVHLNDDFANGAVAAKVWKNIGMEIVSSSGKYVMPDDRLFGPIYRDIATQGKTLIIHSAEPDEAWGLQPPGSSRKYYQENPQWDMSKKAAGPSKQSILDSRDHLLAMNPELRVVGAHFGSMEDHLDQVAAHLDQYPNLAVDTAARIRRLVFQPRDQVRAFILKYQDRILYGTDLHVYAGPFDRGILDGWEKQYARDWRYLATDDNFEYLGQKVEGLNLPRAVLQKLYHGNAVRWIPGILGSQP